MKNLYSLNGILFLLFILLSMSASAQESLNLRGKIVADSIDGSFINIVNVTKEKGAVNDEAGRFEIEVSENDTLFFSSVQYEIKEIYVNREMMDTGFLEVKLEPKVNQLAEVKISNINLSGNLQRDLANIETFNQLDVGIPYPTKPRLSSIDRKLFTASTGSLSLLLNLLNGDIKMLKKAQKNQQLAGLVAKGIDALPLSIFVEELEIPEEHVINFVYFCAEDPKFGALVYNEHPLELLEYYQGKVQYFLQERMGR